MDTVNQMCLSTLPGYAPRGTRDRAALARLTLAELDAALGEFIVKVYNHRVHGETGKPPQARWEAGQRCRRVWSRRPPSMPVPRCRGRRSQPPRRSRA